MLFTNLQTIFIMKKIKFTIKHDDNIFTSAFEYKDVINMESIVRYLRRVYPGYEILHEEILNYIKGILIDSDKQEVREVYVLDNGDFLGEMHKLIGNGCSCIAAPIIYDNEDTLYIDEEGMHNDAINGFEYPDWAYPLVGNGLIIGADDEGDNVDAKSTIEDISQNIVWRKNLSDYKSQF